MQAKYSLSLLLAGKPITKLLTHHLLAAGALAWLLLAAVIFLLFLRILRQGPMSRESRELNWGIPGYDEGDDDE